MSELFLTPSPSTESYFYSSFDEESPNNIQKKCLAVIYVGLEEVIVTIYKLPKLKHILAKSSNLQTHNPRPGWYEQDAEEIINTIYNCCTSCCNDLIKYGYSRSDIEAISITNERETIVLWDARTGRSLYRAITANDTRTIELAERIILSLPGENGDHYKSITGLPLLPKFAALKILWLQENVAEVRSAIRCGCCKFGNLDSWIIWNMTNGSLHVTDVTNASHTMLMNLKTLDWDKTLLKAFSINKNILPCICPCSKLFGRITDSACILKNAQITGIIADQQALLMGQLCLQAGKMSVHAGDSCCLLCNTGYKCVFYRDAITTVAYKLDDNSCCVYALEGNVLKCGKLFKWLHLNVRLLNDEKSAESVAKSVKTTNHVYFVPAFSGLEAPYWRKDARGVLVGLTRSTNRGHIVRAAFESICFQIYDIIEFMRNSGEYDQDVVYAAGTYASKELLMQMLADTSGVIIVRFDNVDSIAYGAAICAGHAIGAVDMPRIKQGIWRQTLKFTTYIPYLKIEERMEGYAKWRQAVARSVGWAAKSKEDRILGHRATMGILFITTILLIRTILKKSTN